MDRVRLPLFLLRAGVFIVMLMWTLDKFIHPGHAAGVFKKFYSIGGIFFAAWPMLAACITLYLLRDLDTLWAMQKT